MQRQHDSQINDPKLQARAAGLTSIQFEKLLQRLDSDRDSAGRKYEDLRSMLIRFFEWNSCVYAEDLADQTFNRIARRLEDQEIHDVAAFAWGVAKNIRHEVHEHIMRHVPMTEVTEHNIALAKQEQHENKTNDRLDRKRLLTCLYRCTRQLSPEDRALFMAYHTPSTNQALARQQLAETLGITIGALRMQVIRLRDRLRQCMEKCIAAPGRISMYLIAKSETKCRPD